MSHVEKEREATSILVVDDTPANLNVLSVLLKEQGYRARPVPSGALALQAAAAEPPDLILLDIGMPEMDGFEVCRRLKADPSLMSIPVIFITAHAYMEDKVMAFSLGGVDYVTKPFQFEEVLARVATHLELRRQKRALERSYERLTEFENARDSLVHMLVHDLRSPLTVIICALDFLKTEGARSMSAESRADLDECLVAAKRMTEMITSVLDVSKMESGAMTMAPSHCDLVALVGEVLSEMRSLVGERTIILEPAMSPVPVVADKELIARVVQNMLSNALKFTPRVGEIRIVTESTQDVVRFTITDSGPGVPREFQERIFEKFGQVEARSRNGRHSTGLGLTFCKLAVQAHGGCIGVESVEGKEGSSFWFTLPRTGVPCGRRPSREDGGTLQC